MAMKVVRQARLELSGGSTPDQLRPPNRPSRSPPPPPSPLLDPPSNAPPPPPPPHFLSVYFFSVSFCPCLPGPLGLDKLSPTPPPCPLTA